MKYDWQPPRFGEKQADDVTCWAFGITHGMRDVPKLAEKLKQLDKLVGAYPDMLIGTFVIFRSKSDAVYGRNVIKEDFPCGGNIRSLCRGEVSKWARCREIRVQGLRDGLLPN